tara:strand:- start:2273 stop:2569 length:297 start_codon:yes stop_codon:yes gene_type:complete
MISGLVSFGLMGSNSFLNIAPGDICITLNENCARLRYLLGMNEWLESLFYRLYFSIERPYLSFEAEASFNIDFVFVIKEYHAFSNVAASFSEPLCADL